MKKGIKKLLIIVGVIISILVIFVVIDTSQALIFNNSPVFHKREYICRQVSAEYIDKGILVNHYHCGNVTETLFKTEKTECTVCYD